MKRIKLILLVLLSVKSYAQEEVRRLTTIVIDDIQSDSFNLLQNKDFEKRIKLQPIEKSSNEFEIRFYELEGLSGTRNLKVLELKNKSWIGTQYSESNYPKTSIKKFALEAPNGFEELIQKLLQNNLTRLPSQKELNLKMKKYGLDNAKRGKSEQVILVNDGYSYCVEFKIRNKFRIYTFSNPEIYADFYNDVQELKDFVAIKNIFNSELKIK